MQYRAEIDGLRALAVIPVILFHAGFAPFSGGYVGVDVFFVISGYLITSLILADLGQGRFSLVHFYERRARRILPALFFVMLCCLPAAWFWLMPEDLQNFAQSVLAVSLFSSNILFWWEQGYFAPYAELKPLLHTWSLAVEEQYYILFPLLLMALWRFGKQRLLAVLIPLFVLSLAYAHWAAYRYPFAAFYLLPSRGWELLLGAFVAVYFQRHPNAHFSSAANQTFSLVGLILVLYAVFAFGAETPFPSLYALIPTLGTILIIVFAREGTWVHRWLTYRPMVGIGLVSYSAYLWHQPLFAFARHTTDHVPSLALMAGLSLLSLALSYVTWRWIEQPFRQRGAQGHRIGRRAVFASAVVAMVCGVLLGFVGDRNEGFYNRFTPAEQQLLHYGADYRSRLLNNPKDRELLKCFLEVDVPVANYPPQCISQSADNQYLIWGDSHALALAYGLHEVQEHVSQFTASGCPPVLDLDVPKRKTCRPFNDYVLAKIAELKPAHVIVHANWLLYTRRDWNVLRDLETMTAFVSQTLAAIQQASPTSEVMLVGGVPQWGLSLPTFMVRHDIALASEQYVLNPRYTVIDEINTTFQAMAERQSVRFGNPLQVLCEVDRCLTAAPWDEGVEPTAWDYGHMTGAGAVFLAERLF